GAKMTQQHAELIQYGKDRLDGLYTEVDVAFKQGESGQVLMDLMCQGVDDLLIHLWQKVAPASSESIDFVAVGGYGRAELAPQSDWDVWFLLPDDVHDEMQQDIEAFLYVMWDMNAKIGHAVRSVAQTLDHIKEDWNSATAAQEMRLLCGKGDVFAELKRKIAVFFKKQRKKFIAAKLLEHQARHQRTGNTAFMMEPDIKECQGGLRDVQSVFWIAKAWYGVDNVEDLAKNKHISPREMQDLCSAQDFLWRCRVGLHLEAKRPSDRLSFEQQASLADMMGYSAVAHRPAVDGLMKDYFRQAGRITRVTGLLLQDFEEKLHPIRWRRCKKINAVFNTVGKQVGLQHVDVFKRDPLNLLRIFNVGQDEHRWLSSAALRQIREDVRLIDDGFRDNPEAHRIFLRILRHPRNVFWALKEMNATGVLGRFMSDFRDVVGLGQFNQYHAYTVDEHTIRAVGEARNMMHHDREERLPLAQEVIHRLKRPDLLYLALIFHDIAKGMAGDHSVNGEKLAREFCLHIGLTEDGAALVAWLVREHLTMAMVSQRSDLSDPEVIQNFANKVGSMERLNNLLCLTVADIAAVGPNVWNDWKGALLSQLYHATRQVLMDVPPNKAWQEEQRQIRINSTLKLSEQPALLQPILTKLPQRVIAHFPPNQLLPIAQLLQQNLEHGVSHHIDEDRCDTMILIHSEEQKALFAKLTAVIAAGQVNVVAAHAFSLGEGRVLDVFYVQDKQAKTLRHPADLHRLSQRIIKTLQADKAIQAPKKVTFKSTLLMKRVPVRARHLPSASTIQTAIEVSAAERPALLAQLAYAIHQAGFDIRGAAISSFGERVVDVFFIQNHDGEALQQEHIQHLCATLQIIGGIHQEKDD
ncbi:MAG: [protein-PII] uridylyltransferase, partial [Mariprofundaceae bacterium]|nr:[protein-PII] uridylyltransferase [Mariprofundaceae bacterium]